MCEKKSYCARTVDPCIQGEVNIINSNPGLRTLSSCCGHSVYPRTIIVQNISKGYYKGLVYEFYSGIKLGNGRRKLNRYYKKDKRGFYYIPELTNKKINI